VTQPIERLMSEVREFKTLLNQHLRGDVPANEVAKKLTEIEHSLTVDRCFANDSPSGYAWFNFGSGSYRMATEHWSTHLNAELQTVLWVCTEAEAEVSEFAGQFRSNANVNPDYLQPFSTMRRLLRTTATQMRSHLEERGAWAPPPENQGDLVRRVVERITSRQQINLGLLGARDEMKLNAPSELHDEIDRSFGKAIDELQD